MATTSNGEAIPCGGCPGGYYCEAIAGEQSMWLWEMPTISGRLLYGCEFIDRDGASTEPTIVQRDEDGYFSLPAPADVSQSRLFEKHDIADQAVLSVMRDVGELCLRRIALCPGARTDYGKLPVTSICPAGLGQTSADFFMTQLSLVLRRDSGFEAP